MRFRLNSLVGTRCKSLRYCGNAKIRPVRPMSESAAQQGKFKPNAEALLLDNLTDNQRYAVKSDRRRVLVIAGAGSGKTEVMARRVAWWIAKDKVPRDSVVAFTFTERAAEEMKFRIRYWLEKTVPDGEEVALGGMYVGTIHGFCLAKIREYW